MKRLAMTMPLPPPPKADWMRDRTRTMKFEEEQGQGGVLNPPEHDGSIEVIKTPQNQFMKEILLTDNMEALS